jgi:hypothetical protein
MGRIVHTGHRHGGRHTSDNALPSLRLFPALLARRAQQGRKHESAEELGIMGIRTYLCTPAPLTTPFAPCAPDDLMCLCRSLTLALSRARKRERGTSGRWRASAAVQC